jgi:hypothetical protein
MQTITHAAPMTAFKALNIEGTAEDKYAKQYNADKTEVNPPQYVTFNVQCPVVTATVFAMAIFF